MKFKELKEQLPNTVGKTPSYKRITESTVPVIINQQIIDANVTVFANGYATYSVKEGKKLRSTVFGVNKIAWKYRSVTGKIIKIPETAYADLDAVRVIAMFGERRLAHNAKSRQQRKIKFHLDCNGTDYAKEATVSDFADDVLAEMQSEISNKILYKALQALTKKQIVVIYLKYFEEMSQQEIADVLSIGRTSVSDRLDGAIKKIKKFF